MQKGQQQRSLRKPKATKPVAKVQKRKIATKKVAKKIAPKSSPVAMIKRNMSAALSTHMDTPYNNANTHFEFTPESMKKIEKVLTKFPANYKQSAVMPVLFIAQEQNDNWLPLVAMDKVAELLDMPKMRVYEVATFYTMYNRDKVGKFHIQVCGTTTCLTMGARDIKKAAKKFAGVSHDGQISKDGNFCIVEVECLGACTNAPMIQVNNHEFYENLTTDSIVNVMKGLIDGTAKVGPQNGQRVAEGPKGQTTLHNYTDSFPSFNLERIDTKLKEMTANAKGPAAPTPPAAPAAPTPAAKKEEPKVEAKVEVKKEEPKVEAKKQEPKVETKKEEPKAEAKKAPEAKKETAAAPPQAKKEEAKKN
jgi:NADH dehydrogenase (ubiquinone) flavoprotein 2